MSDHKKREINGCVTVNYTADEKAEIYDSQASDLNKSPAFNRLIQRFVE